MRQPSIIIGMPVYNGEKFILRALTSLLSQTYTNFRIIISDNHSTDDTEQICNAIAKKDSRITYIRHDKNMGAVWNFNFVLEYNNSDYFMWAAIDDIWEPTFIEKNITNLENNPNLVASISEVQFFFDEEFNKCNIISPKKYELVRPIVGTYEKRVEFIFNFNHPQCFYSIFRTNALQSKIIRSVFGSWDYAVILNALKYGDLGVVDEILLYMYRGHKKSNTQNSLLKSMKAQKLGLIPTYFPFLPLTIWCMKNLGLKVSIKNLIRFVKMNYRAERLILLELVKSH